VGFCFIKIFFVYLEKFDLNMSKNLNIALVAHDARKQELVEWCKYNLEWLSNHNLYATGTTGKLIEDINSKWVPQEDGTCMLDGPLIGKITKLLSGPLGGDQQIGAMIAEDKIDVLIFFCDNMETQGHQQDIGALSRLASLYNIAFATNRKTADLIITSSLLEDESYERIIPSVIERYKNRM
jgi:methylglyoxal synthase